MYIVMSRSEVVTGEEWQFEQSSIERHYKLKDIPGYLSAHFVRGGTNGVVTFYSLHTRWTSKDDFLNWCTGE